MCVLLQADIDRFDGTLGFAILSQRIVPVLGTGHVYQESAMNSYLMPT